jgi:hypothetical protein
VATNRYLYWFPGVIGLISLTKSPCSLSSTLDVLIGCMLGSGGGFVALPFSHASHCGFPSKLGHSGRDLRVS